MVYIFRYTNNYEIIICPNVAGGERSCYSPHRGSKQSEGAFEIKGK